MAKTKRCIDKRLVPAKVIGIILFVFSIVSFSSGIFGGLMNILITPDTNIFYDQKTFFSDPMHWVFRHFTLILISISFYCIPLFFSARALYRFKEWGRIVCIIMIFIIIFFITLYGYAFYSADFAPLPFRMFSLIITLFYILVLCVPIYFLMRRKTKEGIANYNKQLLEKASLLTD